MKTMAVAQTVAQFVLAILVVAAALAFSQTDTPDNRHPAKHSTITGCLTSGTNDTYRVVDQKTKRTNIVFSTRVHLDSYVGQSVTLVGDQSATPSTDTGTARPMAQFRVLEVHPASGKCH